MRRLIPPVLPLCFPAQLQAAGARCSVVCAASVAAVGRISI